MPDELPPGARAAAEAPARTPEPAPPGVAAPAVAAPVVAAPVVAAPAGVPQAALPARPAAPQLAAPQPAPIAPSVIVDRTALQPQRSSGSASGYALAFLPGTTSIASADRAMLARLAAAGRGATFRVTGYADEQGTGRALDLPIARARAVADALRAEGVAAEAIELGGAARPGPAGRGAEVTLVHAR
jgi:outer membrane protein OmpA-like peptidoglycan-associated protein